MLTLPPADWRGAARAENIRPWGGTADLAGDPNGFVAGQPPITAAEYASAGVTFGHSSLVNSGPPTRQSHGAGRQFAGLGKDIGLQIGNLGLDQILGEIADGLRDQ